jgi:hypothetical protein
MDNMQLWNSVAKTDPRQVKEITGKQYKGNSPKPYYIVRRLTETFGPCGIGWGSTILSERMEPLGKSVLHIAVVRFWYVLDGKRGEVEQIGQTLACYEKADGSKTIVDEDAPKKSVTDALVKCASYLGFGGDIFAGRWDDSKYVAELRREFAEKPADNVKQHPATNVKAVADRLAALPDDEYAAEWDKLDTKTQDAVAAIWNGVQA